MACNNYVPHLYVLPEDDANRQVANGFTLHPLLDYRAIYVLPVASGWRKALSALTKTHVRGLERYPQRRLVLVIDFDNDFDTRLQEFRDLLPNPLQHRVFLLGTLSEPEQLRSNLKQDYEKIGCGLSQECVDEERVLWDHPLLKHNQQELERLLVHVKPFLFR